MTSDEELPDLGLPPEKREFPRFNHRSEVRLTDAEGGVREVLTRDLSHGGLFLVIKSDALPALGSRVRVQALDIEDALEQEAEVVRTEPGAGIAIKFCE